jgi:hypothetical protein
MNEISRGAQEQRDCSSDTKPGAPPAAVPKSNSFEFFPFFENELMWCSHKEGRRVFISIRHPFV